MAVSPACNNVVYVRMAIASFDAAFQQPNEAIVRQTLDQAILKYSPDLSSGSKDVPQF